MAIETGGYRPDVHLAVPDTNFVQPDVQAVNKGLLSQFELASDAEKAKAFKMMWEENQALHDERHNAAKLKLIDDAQKLQAAMQLRPQKTANEGFTDQTTALLNPGARGLALGQQGLDVGNMAFNTRMQPIQQDTRASIIQNENDVQPTLNTTALDRAALEGDKVSGQLHNVGTENDTAAYQAETANQAAQFANSTQDMTQKIALEKLQSEYANAKTDIERANVLERLKVLQAQAGIKKTEGEAIYYGGRNDAVANKPSRDQTFAQLDRLEKLQTAELNRAIDASGTTLGAYRDQKRLNPGMTPNPIAEAGLQRLAHFDELQSEVIAESQARRDEEKQNRNAKANPPAPPVAVRFNPITPQGPGAINPMTYDQQPTPRIGGGGAGARPLDTSSLTPVQLQAYQWALSNPNDPRSGQILEKLSGQ
jgi:hypothetical protein